MTVHSSIPRFLLSLVLLVTGLSAHAAVDYPREFDSLGPTVQSLTLPSGRVAHYIDDGEVGDIPVVFTGGLGTSVRVIRLLDFMRTFRRELGIRIITVERNGFGQTAFDPSLDMNDFSAEVEAVLAHLGIERFAVFGISGGGPYTAMIASRNAERLLSVHMAATLPSLDRGSRCTTDSPASPYRDMLRYPMQFFGFPANSPMHAVEGFQDTAFDEAARAHNLRGQAADPAPLDHETGLYCKHGKIDTSGVKAPVYVYHGLADGVLGDSDPEIWRTAYPNADVTLRTYEGEGHDVQYRHLDQILLDIAGRGDRTLICRKGRARMVDAKDVAAAVAKGAIVGSCAWR